MEARERAQIGVGGDNLSAVIAQDDAPGHARAMSKFSEFGKTVKP